MPPAVDVLLIEDNALDIKLFRTLLEDTGGLTVHPCSHADEAFAWLRDHKPRIIHTDVMLPEISGWEIIEQLKRSAETRDIPIIVVTAGGLSVARANSALQLVEAALVKPIWPAGYLKTVQSILANASSQA